MRKSTEQTRERDRKYAREHRQVTCRPPYFCPWRHSDGCAHVSETREEHRAHCQEQHEAPLLRKRIAEMLKIN